VYLETCRIVLARPSDGSPNALVYVAESMDSHAPRVIATSPAFHPEVDAAAHRQALAELETRLAVDGWRRDPAPRQALIGLRFHRWSAEREPART
jgi:hypothetical protein